MKNPSFESGADGKPAAWEPVVYGGEADLTWEKAGHGGERSVAIASSDGADAGWRITLPVKPFSVYRLSAWIKTENVKLDGGRGALMNIHQLDGAATKALTGDNDWTRVQFEFESGGHDSILINCLFGGWGNATGKAFYDDVGLELLKTADLKAPSAVVDISNETGEISQYIYGQFIEHLGRCIYGGIWSEMLVDRKFSDLVASRRSPWRRVGGEVGWSLTMDVERPYVDDWSVKVTVTDRADDGPHGIRQGGLGIVKGKEYVGRVVLAGEGTVEATLAWGGEPDECQTVVIENMGTKFAAKPLRFKAGATTDDASLTLSVRNGGEVWIGTASLMPGDNVKGMRADTLAVLKELDSPLYRWPGGNFVSGYDWRDGLGPADKRPTRKNPAWQGLEYNDFGIDEFIVFCQEVDAEPLVVVNTGLGSPELAAAIVEYCNGSADTQWGKRRTQNGHPEPYNVKWWGVGNEMYGGWQLGHTSLDAYVTRHNEFVRAMREVDPNVKLVAVGASGRWSEKILAECADAMDLLSEHFYCRQKSSLLEHTNQIPDSVRAKAKAHRRYWANIPALKNNRIPIALDEWNYWYGEHVYGELGTRYFLRDALGIARGIHEMSRHSDVFFMANYAQTVNVIGCIKTTKTAAGFAATGLPLKLYRQHFGSIPVKVTGSGVFVDVAVALTKDRKKATIGIVNSSKRDIPLELKIEGGKLKSSAKRYTITGEDDMAYNNPGEAPAVKIIEDTVGDFNPAKVKVPPISNVLYVVDIAGK